MFDSNNFTVFNVLLSVQNVQPIKKKAVYTLILFHTLIHFLDQIRPQLAYFLKLQYLILVIFSFQFNFQLQVVRSAASAVCKESCVR